MDYRLEKLEIVEGLQGRPAFATREEYERFRREFAEAVRPEMEKHALARRKSEEAAMFHWVK